MKSFTLRLPDAVGIRMVSQAEKNHRSLNAEIVIGLEFYLEGGEPNAPAIISAGHVVAGEASEPQAINEKPEKHSNVILKDCSRCEGRGGWFEKGEWRKCSWCKGKVGEK